MRAVFYGCVEKTEFPKSMGDSPAFSLELIKWEKMSRGLATWKGEHMLRLRVEDKNPQLNRELAVYMEEKKGILEKILKGQKEYQDALGWFRTEKWANQANLDYFCELARKSERTRTYL